MQIISANLFRYSRSRPKLLRQCACVLPHSISVTSYKTFSIYLVRTIQPNSAFNLMVSFCNLQYNVVQPRCGTISYNNNNNSNNNSNNNNNDNDKYNDNHNHNHNNNDNDMMVIVIAIVIIIIPLRHDSVIDLTMKLKALANWRGHIVADTLLPTMFLGLRKLGNICCGHKMFLNKIRNIFVSRTQNLCTQQMLRARANGETFVSATMCPHQRNNVSSFARAFTGRIVFKTTFRCPHDTIIRSIIFNR